MKDIKIALEEPKTINMSSFIIIKTDTNIGVVELLM